MNIEDSKVDALYAISREIREGYQEIRVVLKMIVAQLEDMTGYLSEINKSLPNPLEHE